MYVYPRAGGGGAAGSDSFNVYPMLWRDDFDPTGLIPGASLLNAAHDHHPYPFAPAGLIAGASLIDATKGGAA